MIDIRHGDCLEVLADMPANGVEACVTDPPYHLGPQRTQEIGHPSWNGNTARVRKAAKAGFMGKQWDGGDIAFQPETWAAVLRVLKPGAHLLAFGGTKGFHRMACAIEDAGFEIRDTIMWLYGSGFPKSHNQAGEWEGWGTALKPAYEPIVMARKPLVGTVAGTLAAHRCGAINIDASRVATTENLNGETYSGSRRTREGVSLQDDHPDAAPLSRLRNGAGEYEQPEGRWPANVIHDGSDEVLAAFPDAGPSKSGGVAGWQDQYVGGTYKPISRTGYDEPSGSAARFFYCAKAGKADRGAGNKHPTVKPSTLMRYLCRLVTPPGGTVLDPFMGSGSTGKAAVAEGFKFTGIEREVEYVAIAQQRLGLDAGVFA